MALDVFTWNLQNGLSYESRHKAIYENLRREVGDAAGVIVLTEVCGGAQANLKTAFESLEEFAKQDDYQLTLAPYDDEQPRAPLAKGWTDQYLALLSRLPVISSEVGRLATRSAITTTVNYEEPVSITAYHGDDRSASTRTKQVSAYYAQSASAAHQVLAGDFNDLRSTSFRARSLRVLAPLTGRISPEAFSPKEARGVSAKLKRLDSLAIRAVNKASGESVELLEAAGFEDADSRHRATHLLGQLDYILYRGLARTSFRRAKKTKSDHRLIHASFELD